MIMQWNPLRNIWKKGMGRHTLRGKAPLVNEMVMEIEARTNIPDAVLDALELKLRHGGEVVIDWVKSSQHYDGESYTGCYEGVGAYDHEAAAISLVPHDACAVAYAEIYAEELADWPLDHSPYFDISAIRMFEDNRQFGIMSCGYPLYSLQGGDLHA